ncbi:MAG: cytochrome c3 family protein, partial [Polyangiaceae bacterium]
MSEKALFSEDPRAKGGLRRVRAVIRAAASSDVKRVREMALATLGAAVALAVALLFFGGPASLRAQGPVARPHQVANVACASCHTDRGDGKGAAGACTTCHGQTAHGSTRPAHRALAQAGKLTCVGCHPAHGDSEGIT